MLNAEVITQALSCGHANCRCNKQSGKNYITHCPAHKDNDPSLSISEKDGKILVKCFGGCTQQEVIAALKERNLWPGSKPGANMGNNKAKATGKIVATYDYVDAESNLLFQVVRYQPKTFRQRRPDGKGGWIWNLEGVSVVPYCLPEILSSTRVYICEGEEDVKALRSLGLTATTNPGGASKWREEFSQYFQSKEIVILPDNDEPGRKHARDILQKLHGAITWGKVVELPKLPPKGDPRDWVNAGGRVEELEALVQNTPEWIPTLSATAGPYQISDGVMSYEKSTKHGPVLIPLCNFSARIIGEVVHDDGAELQTYFVVEGALQDGRPLPPAQVLASQFSGLSWVTTAWGNRAVVFAGTSTRDHLRAAIQLLSDDVLRTTVFRHVGWRMIDGRWVYLQNSGGIDAEGQVAGVEVRLEGALKSYDLPAPPEDEMLTQAVQASLQLVNLGPLAVTYPLLAGAYRAPLGECAPVDMSLFTVGHTGAQKTALSAIFQSHYGANFNGRNLPGNWLSTGNYLEKQSFLAKDALFTVDDFVPRGSPADIQKLNSMADRLLRGQANQSGRGRMRADGSLRPQYIPKGLVQSSGEDIPTGQSLGARMFIIELKRGDVNLSLLTQAQANAGRGLYSQALAGYLRWLAPRIDDLKKALPARQVELREAARQERWAHDKTPEIVACLQAGFEMFLRFAVDVGAIAPGQEKELFSQCWNSLLMTAKRQGTHQEGEDPTLRFLALLGAGLTSGRAYISDAEKNGPPPRPHQWGWRLRTFGLGESTRDEWQPQGNGIGWLDGDNLLLEPDAAFAVVQKIAKEQDNSLPLTQRTLWKRFSEKGLLASREPSQNRNTVRWSIASTRKRVIHLKAGILCSNNGPNGPIGPETDNHAGFTPDDFNIEGQKPVHTSGPGPAETYTSRTSDDLQEVIL